MLLCAFVCGLLDVPGAPVSPFPFPPGPHPRRGLEGRRDVVTIEAGGHQIQSVSLSRAMAGAFITEVRAPTPATCTPQCKTGFSIACVVCHVRWGVWGVGYCVCVCVRVCVWGWGVGCVCVCEHVRLFACHVDCFGRRGDPSRAPCMGTRWACCQP